jgi:aryl-alcohol dehydrogenase-like predicted oxidoreductase
VARKLDLVPQLEEVASDAGMSLTHLALAFTLSHPAVSAAIIGPRTMEQLEGLLGAGEVALDDESLDRIDKLVPPGTNVNDADAGWVSPAVAQAWRRRRPVGAR